MALFNNSYKKFFENQAVYYPHYSARGTDKQWVEGLWRKLNIKADFNEAIDRYK